MCIALTYDGRLGRGARGRVAVARADEFWQAESISRRSRAPGAATSTGRGGSTHWGATPDSLGSVFLHCMAIRSIFIAAIDVYGFLNVLRRSLGLLRGGLSAGWRWLSARAG